MNIEKIKNKLKSFGKSKIKIKVNLGRNKYEYYEGVINKIHPNVFVVETNKGIKAFSYSDIVIKNVILTKFN